MVSVADRRDRGRSGLVGNGLASFVLSASFFHCNLPEDQVGPVDSCAPNSKWAQLNLDRERKCCWSGNYAAESKGRVAKPHACQSSSQIEPFTREEESESDVFTV